MRADAFADDVEIDDEMLYSSGLRDDARAFIESGGERRPPREAPTAAAAVDVLCGFKTHEL